MSRRWMNYKGEFGVKELKRTAYGFTLVVESEPNPHHGGHFWRAKQKGLICMTQKAPTVELAQREAILWAWQQVCADDFLDLLKETHLLTLHKKPLEAAEIAVGWLRDNAIDPTGWGLLLLAQKYADEHPLDFRTINQTYGYQPLMRMINRICAVAKLLGFDAQGSIYYEHKGAYYVRMSATQMQWLGDDPAVLPAFAEGI